MRIKVRYTMRSLVSHIGETASVGSYFQTVLTKDGKIPAITGNSIRGQLRDAAALDMLQRLGCKVSKEVFHILFSGGNLNTTLRNDVEKAKSVRAHFPALSLLGGGLGDMIMAGKMVVGFAYPVCSETEDITGVQSDASWRSLVGEMEFTRFDDAKNDELSKYITDASEELTAKASTQMRYSVQYLAAGTEFAQEIDLSDGVTPLELGALYAAFAKWFSHPYLGGMSSKGFGRFDAVVGDGDISVHQNVVAMSERVSALVQQYHGFIDAEGDQYFSLLSTKEAKHGRKKSNAAD